MSEQAAAEAMGPTEEEIEESGPSETTTAFAFEPKEPVPGTSKEAAPEAHHHTSFPDGGLRAWTTVAGAWLVSSVTFGYMNAYGVYQTYYVQTLLPSYSTSAISWIGSIQLFLLFAMGLITGRLFDEGYFRYLTISGTILYAGCLFAQSAAQQDGYYQIFLSQGVGQGIAQGLVYLPSFGVISHHFQKRRALAMGIAVSGSSTGGVFFPIMLNNLFIRSGYAWTVRAVGFLVLGLLVLANIMMSTRLPPHKGDHRPKMSTFFKDPPYMFAVSGAFLVGWGIFYPFFYIQLYTLANGISETFSFYTLAIINAASIFGRTVPNLFADKAGPVTLMTPASFITAVLTFALIACKTLPAITVFCLLYGFFSGAYVSLMAPMFASMADSMAEIGARMGFGLTIIGIAALTGTPIDGALLGNGPTYIWWKPEVFSGVCIILGCVLMAVSWILLRKNKAMHGSSKA